MLQIQQDLWEATHREALSKVSNSPGMSETVTETQTDNGRNSPSISGANNSHRRSASADFCQLIENDMENLKQGHLRTSRRYIEVGRSDSRASIPNSSFTSSVNKQSLPIHLISAKNEQKVNPKNPQQIPTKLSGQSSVSSLSGISQKLSFRLASSTSTSSLPSQGSGGSLQTNNSSSLLKSSSLKGVMKLAQPGGSKGKSSGIVSSDGKQGSPKQDQKGNKTDGVIYF